MIRPLTCPLLSAVAGVLALAGCSTGSGSEGEASGAGQGEPIVVQASDDACAVSITDLPPGTYTFSVTNNGTQVTEFYIYAEDDRVMAEVENITPGLTRELIVELPAGEYETSCKPGMTGDGIRGTLTVADDAQALSQDTLLAEAIVEYSAYVQGQTGQPTEKNDEFVAAVLAGDIPTAKAL